MTKPNLFKFATSELSQDAFICWLLAWNHTDFEEAKVAKEFIAFLYNSFMDTVKREQDVGLWESGDYKYITQDDIGAFLNDKMPAQQKFKTDVFFVVYVKGEAVAFIIEDKTSTSVHDNQLIRYVKEVSEDKEFNTMPIVRVYYKTGYLFNEDTKACEQAKYTIIDAEMMLDFLKKHELNHSIYQDYKSFIRDRYAVPQEAAIKGLESGDVNVLKKESMKYEFMKRLAVQCEDSSPILNHGSGVGKNSSWAQYRFHATSDEYGDVSEYIFWRIESLSKGVALTLRQYANISKHKEHAGEKKKKLNEYRQHFEEISKEVVGLEFVVKLRKDSKGANSSQIALLYISKKEKGDQIVNSISDIYKYLPAIHHNFKDKIQGSENKHE